MTEMQIVSETETKIEENTNQQLFRVDSEKLSVDFHLGTDRVNSLKEYLKRSSVKTNTKENLKHLDLNTYNNVLYYPIEHELHIKNYCKIIKHLLKLEYHHFDHEWSHNINRFNSTSLVDYEALAVIPGRLEHYITSHEPDGKLQRLHDAHPKIIVEHNFKEKLVN